MANEQEFARDSDLGAPLLTGVQTVRAERIMDEDVDRIEKQLLLLIPKTSDERFPICGRPKNAPVQRSIATHRLVWVGTSVCTVLILSGFVANLFSKISLADVLENVSKQSWVHEKYSDGEETWTSKTEGKRFSKEAGGRIQLFDEQHFVWMQYLPGEDHITESRATKEQLAEISRRNLTNAVLAKLSPVPKGYKLLVESKRETENVDGREVLRFDLFRINALDQRVLECQLWVDSGTKLPMRSRRWIASTVEGSTEQTFVEGTFGFAEKGPASIYEIGVPAGLKIVRAFESDERVAVSPDVDEVLNGIKKAMAAFPERFRLLAWPIVDEESPNSWHEGVDRIFWDGNPKRVERKGLLSHGLIDWSGVCIRQERFHLFNQGDQPNYIPFGGIVVPEFVASFPQTAPEVEKWLQDRNCESPCVSDGTKAFAIEGHRHPKRLQVTSINRGPALSSIPFSTNAWPREYQWPVFTFFEDGILNRHGVARILSNPTESVPGTIALRLDSSGGQRFDFYLDPSHDFICLKLVQWSDGDKNVVSRFVELDDLQQFSSGQWYATRIKSTTFSDAPGGRRSSVSKRALDIQRIERDGFPKQVFDGNLLIDEAKRNGYRITPMN